MTPPNVPFYSYMLTPNPVPSNGALQFVFQQKWETPVQMLQGSGVIAGQFSINGSGQPLRSVMALTPTSIQGAGVIAGSTQFQRLWRPDEYGQIDVGDEVIP